MYDFNLRVTTLFLLLLVAGGCLPVLVPGSQDTDNKKTETGTINLRVQLPANAETEMLGKIKAGISVEQLFGSLIINGRTVATTAIKSDGDFSFSDVPLNYDNYRINVRGGKIELHLILAKFPKSSDLLEIDSSTTARVLLYDRLRLSGSQILYSKLESGVLDGPVKNIQSAIEEAMYQPDISEFLQGTASILKLSTVQSTLMVATGDSINLLLGKSTSTTTTSTSSTSTSTASTSSTSTTTTSTTSTTSSRPTVELTTPSGTQSGDVTITYVLKDEDSSLASITLKYSNDSGSTFASATTRGMTSHLSTSPGGNTKSIIWESEEDLPGTTSSQVQVKINSFDTEGAGGSDTTESFSLQN
ncbi:hypothetical protein ACFL35_10385 [Candidatus Riflebacteria bacterium]